MIILEIIKAISEMFFWITFTCVLLCVLRIIRQKKLDVTEKIKKLNEGQNQMRAELEENQNLMENELKGYIRNCNNAIEQLSKKLDMYRNKSENYIKRITDEQRELSNLHKPSVQFGNQKKDSSLAQYASNEITKYTGQLQCTDLTEVRQKPRRIGLNSIKSQIGESGLFIESSEGAMVVVSEKNNEIAVKPDIDILMDGDFRHCGLSLCFETNSEVVPGATYKIESIRCFCFMEKYGTFYKVSKKGKIDIVQYI